MKRTIGFLIGLALVGASCGQEGSTSQQAKPSAATAASPSAAAGHADPLEGEWRTEFTCQDSVRAIERRLSAKQIHEQVGSWGTFNEVWTPDATEDDPCRGATGTTALLVRFADGNLALFDAETGELGATAPYELVDERSISVSDAHGNFCEGTKPPTACPVTWKFEIAGDEVTFHVTPDAFVIGAWESAPFERVS